MKTPRLRETVTVYKPSDETTNEWGAPDGDAYTKVGTRRAEVDEDGGSIDRRAGRDEPQQRVAFRMRYWDEVDTSARLEWDGKTLWVSGVSALDRDRRWMEVQTYLDPDG